MKVVQCARRPEVHVYATECAQLIEPRSPQVGRKEFDIVASIHGQRLVGGS